MLWYLVTRAFAMSARLIGRIAWFSTDKDFGCIVCPGCCALLLGKDLIDPGCAPAAGQRFSFEPVQRKSALWATQAMPSMPLPDEQSTGVPDDQAQALGRRMHPSGD